MYRMHNLQVHQGEVVLFHTVKVSQHHGLGPHPFSHMHSLCNTALFPNNPSEDVWLQSGSSTVAAGINILIKTPYQPLQLGLAPTRCPAATRALAYMLEHSSRAEVAEQLCAQLEFL